MSQNPERDKYIVNPVICKKDPKVIEKPNVIYVDDLDAPVDRRITGQVTFVVKDALPQGDPENENGPRVDSVTDLGIMTPMGIKRWVRDVLATKFGETIFISRDVVLADKLQEAAAQGNFLDLLEKKGAAEDEEKAEAGGEDMENEEVSNEDPDESVKAKAGKNGKGKNGKGKGKPKRTPDETRRLIEGFARTYFDIRTFGAVLCKPANEKVTGPVQFGMAMSCDPVEVIEHQITQVAVASKAQSEGQDANRTMGRFRVVRFGLYSHTLSVNPVRAKALGFTWRDLGRVFDALRCMWELCNSTLRNNIRFKQMVLFLHESPYGSWSSGKLLDAIKITKKDADKEPLSVDDYDFRVVTDGIPSTVKTFIVAE